MIKYINYESSNGMSGGYYRLHLKYDHNYQIEVRQKDYHNSKEKVIRVAFRDIEGLDEIINKYDLMNPEEVEGIMEIAQDGPSIRYTIATTGGVVSYTNDRKYSDKIIEGKRLLFNEIKKRIDNLE